MKNDINSRGGQGRGGGQGKGGEQGYVFDEIEILYQDNNFFGFSAMQLGCCEYPSTGLFTDLTIKSSMNICHWQNRWMVIFFFKKKTEARSFSQNG